MKIYVTICFIFILQQTLFAQKFNFIVDSLTLDDGLSDISIVNIYQDHEGFIWIGTQSGGLNRYDGYDFKVYKYDPDDSTSLPAGFTGWMNEDKDSNLLIFSNPPAMFDPVHDKFIRFNNSFNVPFSIYKDNDAIFWFVLENKLYQYVKGFGRLETLTSYQFESNITSVYHDFSGKFWIGTDDRTLILWDKYSGKTLEKKKLPIEKILNLPFGSEVSVTINSITDDHQGNLYLAAGEFGFFVLNTHTSEWEHYQKGKSNSKGFSLDFVGAIMIDENKRVLIGAADDDALWGNLNVFDAVKKEFQDTGIGAIPLLQDNQGNTWLKGHWSKGNGAYRLRNTQNPFNQIISRNSILGEISYFDEREDGRIWIATIKNGFFLFDPADKSLLQVDNNPKFIFSIKEDKDRNIWLGTAYTNGLYRYSLTTKQFTHYTHNPDDPNSLLDLAVFDIYQDKNDTIWISSGAALNRYDPIKNHFVHPFSKSKPYFVQVFEDHSGELWINNGYELFLASKPEVKYDHKGVAIQIREDFNGNFWGFVWGKYNALMFINRSTHQITYYGGKEGFPANIIVSIEVANNGTLWMGTDKGLVRFDPQNEQFKLLSSRDGLSMKAYGYRTSLKSKTGLLYFGGYNGFIYFHPDSIKENTFIPPVKLTEFLINNKTIRPGDKTKGITIINKVIDQAELITLPQGTNFTLKFAALNYINPHENQYSYKMEGFDEEWINAGHDRTATYTNLFEGKYTFRVRGSNNDGLWNNEGASIDVVILPPVWRTWWAYTFYILLLGGMIFGSIRFFVVRERLRNKLQLDHAELENVKEMDRVKSQFFTNISHEFRTPLTVILGMLDQIDHQYQQAKTVIQRNARSLLHLVNQMLDLSKLESGMLTLHYIQSDIILYLKYLLESFHSLADQKKITMHVFADIEVLYMDYDPDKLSTIVTNLISNAIKFTPEKGNIYCFMEMTELNQLPAFMFRIKDTGIGIHQDQLAHIFDRFYQVDNTVTRKGEGTGIGLALTKELITLMKGEIKVKSQPQKGSEFTVILPITTLAELTEASISPFYVEDHSYFEDVTSGEQENISISKVKANQNESSILLVEDNKDVLIYLSACLGSTYHILTASNGKEGIDKAFHSFPDIIISDVMMPEMSGYELCNILKQDVRTSHIPIILLTAKAEEEDKLLGLEVGADVYLTKPFNKRELNLHIVNLIHQQEQQWLHFKESLDFQPAAFKVSTPDEKFINRAMEIMDKRKSDPTFGVDAFLKELGISRSLLHIKLKALTGQSTTEFIRNYRLKYAAQLIQKGYGNISEIAYECGFNDQSYFARSFKAFYGLAPSDYNKNKQQY